MKPCARAFAIMKKEEKIWTQTIWRPQKFILKNILSVGSVLILILFFFYPFFKKRLKFGFSRKNKRAFFFELPFSITLCFFLLKIYNFLRFFSRLRFHVLLWRSERANVPSGWIAAAYKRYLPSLSRTGSHRGERCPVSALPPLTYNMRKKNYTATIKVGTL